jgi:hypothetical protein
MFIYILARNSLIKKANNGYKEGIMKWVEIITLRSPGNINRQFVDELLKGIGESDSPKHLIEIKVLDHYVVETDLSIHIYWESEKESQRKSPLGLRFCSALKPLGLLNHSVWVETAALEFPYGNARSGDTLTSERKGISKI